MLVKFLVNSGNIDAGTIKLYGIKDGKIQTLRNKGFIMAVISNGTTLIDNGTLDAAVPAGKMTLLSTQTASASATISFTSGIDSTYDSYVFKFI
jgi:hypothetical protein